MSDTLARTDDPLSGADRRASARQAVRSLAYVALDEGNGGIILNLSEGGLSVQAVTSLMDDFLPGVRFQLSETDSWIETNARITWTSESRKLAGLEFVGLSDESRVRIREWLNRESGTEAPAESAPTPAAEEKEKAAPEAHDSLEVSPSSFTQPFEPFVAGSVARPTEAPAVEYPAEEAPLAPTESSPAAAPSAVALHWPCAIPASPAEPKKTFYLETLVENHWSVIMLLSLLALASLVAGWAAGQGALGRYAAELHLIPVQTPAAPAAPKSAAPMARPAFIEVVSSTNLRWTIPFDGPLNTPVDPRRHQLPPASETSDASSPAGTRKPDIGFHTWVLTPPSQAANSANKAQLKEAPPELSEATNTNENVLTPTGGFSSHALAAPPSLAVPAPSTPTGVVRQGQVVYRVDPIYPEIAKEQHSEGTVRLNVTVGPDGVVRGVALLGGPRLLVEAAEKAVRQWRYTPTLLDGKPVEFQREVDLTFRLAPSQR